PDSIAELGARGGGRRHPGELARRKLDFLGLLILVGGQSELGRAVPPTQRSVKGLDGLGPLDRFIRREQRPPAALGNPGHLKTPVRPFAGQDAQSPQRGEEAQRIIARETHQDQLMACKVIVSWVQEYPPARSASDGGRRGSGSLPARPSP